MAKSLYSLGPGVDDLGFRSQQAKTFFFSPNYPYRLWSQTSWGCFTGVQ